ncbi:MAG: menaquinone biosynthesis protein [Nitrospirae bacterium]|nr:menaquinone biosynthesis protein [Nitrospirota bacterium]
MSDNKLVVGKIPYANVFPIFYVLENEFDCSQYVFVEGVPSSLNRMLREGELDISPSSSLEYLRNKGVYSIIGNHSISSKGEVGSILFFSRQRIEDLDGTVVFASSQSETSVALLKIILKKFYGLSVAVEVVTKPDQQSGTAYLLIGDDALKQQAVYHQSTIADYSFVYDLGEIWYRQTGLPFVFALWIVRNDISGKGGLVDRFTTDLGRAKEIALNKLPHIAKYAPVNAFMTEEEILAYWKKLDYELSDEHRKGLALFDRYRKEVD